MAYIDIDLNEFDLDDLLQEIEDRLTYHNDKDKILKFCKKILNPYQEKVDLTNITINDKSKIEYFFENMDNITEEALKNIVEKE